MPRNIGSLEIAPPRPGEPTQADINRLIKFDRETGAVIVTMKLSADDLARLYSLLEQWERGDPGIETVIRARYALDLTQERDY